jgi:hypothetical protein
MLLSIDVDLSDMLYLLASVVLGWRVRSKVLTFHVETKDTRLCN